MNINIFGVVFSSSIILIGFCNYLKAKTVAQILVAWLTIVVMGFFLSINLLTNSN